MGARYIIGIDLGTTNSAVAFVDQRGADRAVRAFEVPQLVAPGEAMARRQLPSFVYLAGEHDLVPRETSLPWRDDTRVTAETTRIVVGELARTQGACVPSRLVSSAKSWLCHPGVDRAAAILPWGEAAAGDGPKLSPIAAQAEVLAHVKAAWEHAHPEADARFVDQEVVVTVPASFDEAARELTLQAAQQSGYPPVVLLEEPLAAFYAWLARKVSGGGSATQLGANQRVLIFDVGGGTTDFTLITVDADGDGFTRTAVGDHLLLGGDNIDLTLAKIVEQRLTGSTGKKLDAVQWHGLVQACRAAKERLLSDDAPAAVPITVQRRGARLLGGTLKDEVTLTELQDVLLGGFFPTVARDAQVQRGRGGLQEFGLPYASDPAITRHLASFVARHGAQRIDAVLFNGGAMTPLSLRAQVLAQIGAWQGTPPRELPAATPELAVAQGAAYFGLVRRGLATRIKGGTARAFYVGAAGEDRTAMAICVAPKGLEDGSTVELARDFMLLTNRPASFRLYSSSSRQDAPGALVPIGDGQAETVDDGSDLLELPPIVTVLRARGKSSVTVRLRVHITELGALEVHCVETGGEPAPAPASRSRTMTGTPLEGGLVAARTGAALQAWKLSFDMRSGGAAVAATSAPGEATDARHPRIEGAKAAVLAAFRGSDKELAALGRELEGILEARRDEWTLATNRALFDALADVIAERKRTAEHEQRWLHLAGFCLRPGTGAPLDTWRARQMWGVFNENVGFPKSESSRLAWWITWRRIAGGLANGQQAQFYDRLAPLLLPHAKQAKRLAEVKASKQELAEMWRTVAAMERLPASSKLKLAEELMVRMDTRRGRDEPVHLWAMSRLAARVPLYGPLNAVVPASRARPWLEQLMAWDWPEPEKLGFALAQIGRRTGDRSRDLDEDTRARAATLVRGLPGGERAAVLLEEIVALEAVEERVALGDTLPHGLRLILDDDRTADEPA